MTEHPTLVDPVMRNVVFLIHSVFFFMLLKLTAPVFTRFYNARDPIVLITLVTIQQQRFHLSNCLIELVLGS